MHGSSDIPANLSGFLLLAHPGMLDPNFAKTVVLISAHSEEDGALGAIINRPLGKTLGEHDSAFEFDPLGRVPLYVGGPVRPDQIILAGWKWLKTEGIFRLYYGIGPEQARGFLGEDGFEVRAFLGYSGWDKGQIEDELGQQAWLAARLDGDLLGCGNGPELWREILFRVSPLMWIWSRAPDDPSIN